MKPTTSSCATALLLVATSLDKVNSFNKVVSKKSNSIHTPTATEARIVGGIPSAAGAFPYFATIGLESGALCGASLIYEDIVLTAAHCQGAFSKGVRLGVTSFFDTNGIYRQVINQIPHPLWDDKTAQNDIMLLQLESPVPDVPTVPWTRTGPTEGETLTSMGFGLTSTGGSASLVLLQVDLMAIDDDTCNAQYESGGFGSIDSSVQFCAGDPEGTKDICFGDSGGPLVDQNNVQVGVVSFNGGICADRARAAGYTRVSAFADWIEESICQYSSNPPLSCGQPIRTSWPDETNTIEPTNSNIDDTTPDNTDDTTPDTTDDTTPDNTDDTTPDITDDTTADNTIDVTDGTADDTTDVTTNDTTNDATGVAYETTKTALTSYDKTDDDTITARFEITFDEYPDETKWVLLEKSAAGSERVVLSGPAFVALPVQTWGTTFTLKMGHDYAFILDDSYGDGFLGTFSIYTTGQDGNENILVSEPADNNFDFSLVIDFSTIRSGDEKTSARAEPTCADGMNQLSLGSNLSGTCALLGLPDVFHELGYLCKFVDIALECPVTCGICDEKKSLAELGRLADQIGLIDMGDILGQRDCSWLKQDLAVSDRFATACGRTNVALHCPDTCIKSILL